MRPLSNSTRSNSNSSIPGEVRNIATSIAGQESYQDLINLANTVPLIHIFKHYGLRVDEYNRKITCPFKSHKGGRETTPSFYYYAHTNSFRCYGCGIGHQYAHGCEFVAAMDGITKSKAALKVLELFSTDVDEDNILSKRDFSERLEIMVNFANVVREFRQAHVDEKSQKFIEDMCLVYDQHNLKHDHTNEALYRVVERIKEQIAFYKCQT